MDRSLTPLSSLLLWCLSDCLFVCLLAWCRRYTSQPRSSAVIERSIDRSIAFRCCYGAAGAAGDWRLCSPPLDPGAWHPRPRHRPLRPPAGSTQRIVHRISIYLSMYVCLESSLSLEACLLACLLAFQAGAPTLEQRMAIDDTPAHQRIAAAGSSIRKALDCQTFIVSLFSKGIVNNRRKRGITSRFTLVLSR